MKIGFRLREASDGLPWILGSGGVFERSGDCCDQFGYAVAPRGIVYHLCGAASPLRLLHDLDTTTGRDRVMGSLEADWIGGLSVSPDGRRMVYGRGEATSNLMMIEHFR